MQLAPTFIDEPRWVPRESYQAAIQRMTDSLARIPGVISIYQIGSLSSPGISDIDMAVVFEDDGSCRHDPRGQLDDIGRYLFTHPLYATSISLFQQSRSYAFFHNFERLYGNDLNIDNHDVDDNLLQRQWAYEYLIKMMINLVVSRAYNIYKIRSLLLQVKALLYDIHFLGAKKTDLERNITEIIAWRERWFQQRPKNQDLLRNITGLWTALIAFLEEQFKEAPLYLPARERYVIARNIEIHRAERLRASAKGIRLPWTPRRYARKIISLQNRINKFNVHVPFQNQHHPSAVSQALDYTERAVVYNHCHLPYFMPLTSSLVLPP